ncbi:MAG TPA: GntR family transcriptional regulator [Chloroflexi bacterium]|jgi:GntR family transcriptional regulator|nr:GntR family transcriptional regulator [Chloroflexota bacterium]HPO57969.1 GntR family transcriptional regulator [Anaerolineaceae bacterium]
MAVKTVKLHITPANPALPAPLYHQVYADLRQKITSGLLKPGDYLPPELELAEAYQVGRQTVRNAIARLVNEHLVERFPGIGTVVTEQSPRTQFLMDRSFTQQMIMLGIVPSSRVLMSSVGTVDHDAPVELRKKTGAPLLTLMRLRFGNNSPIGIQTAKIVLEACPTLPEHNFNRESLYEVLARDYNLVIHRISHVVRAVPATELHSELLQMEKGQPLLSVRTTAYLSNLDPIESTVSYYRADRYEFFTSHNVSEMG